MSPQVLKIKPLFTCLDNMPRRETGLSSLLCTRCWVESVVLLGGIAESLVIGLSSRLHLVVGRSIWPLVVGLSISI